MNVYTICKSLSLLFMTFFNIFIYHKADSCNLCLILLWAIRYLKVYCFILTWTKVIKKLPDQKGSQDEKPRYNKLFIKGLLLKPHFWGCQILSIIKNKKKHRALPRWYKVFCCCSVAVQTRATGGGTQQSDPSGTCALCLSSCYSQE